MLVFCCVVLRHSVSPRSQSMEIADGSQVHPIDLQPGLQRNKKLFLKVGPNGFSIRVNASRLRMAHESALSPFTAKHWITAQNRAQNPSTNS